MNELRLVIREEVERVLFPCHFLISYDIHESNSALKSKLPEKLKELAGCLKNESLYCFSGGDSMKVKVIRAITDLIGEEAKVRSTADTLIYCVTAHESNLSFDRITANT